MIRQGGSSTGEARCLILSSGRASRTVLTLSPSGPLPVTTITTMMRATTRRVASTPLRSSSPFCPVLGPHPQRLPTCVTARRPRRPTCNASRLVKRGKGGECLASMHMACMIFLLFPVVSVPCLLLDCDWFGWSPETQSPCFFCMYIAGSVCFLRKQPKPLFFVV